MRNVVLLTENEGLGVIFPPATMLFLIVLCHLLKSNAVFHIHVLPFFKNLFLLFFHIFLLICQHSTCILLLPVFTLSTFVCMIKGGSVGSVRGLTVRVRVRV